MGDAPDSSVAVPPQYGSRGFYACELAMPAPGCARVHASRASDVYSLGRVMRWLFRRFKALALLLAPISDMCLDKEPALRPTAAAVCALVKEAVRKMEVLERQGWAAAVWPVPAAAVASRPSPD